MHYTQNRPNQYAVVFWDKNDIKAIHPTWPDERCEEFLAENEEDLYAEMLDAGWILLVERAMDKRSALEVLKDTTKKGESDAS